LDPGGYPSLIVSAAAAVVEEFADETGLAPQDGARLAVVVEELVSNALRHGSAKAWTRLHVTLVVEHGGVALTIEDDGLAFDPTRARSFSGPDPVTGGGVGLALVQAWADDFVYRRAEGRNRVSLTLRPTLPLSQLRNDC
jgi:anti-sigma regulatory factor (Ser/Thr protein kinase)